MTPPDAAPAVPGPPGCLLPAAPTPGFAAAAPRKNALPAYAGTTLFRARRARRARRFPRVYGHNGTA